MKIASASLLVVACALFSGCASAPKVPKEFDVNRATVVAGAEDPSIVIDGVSGKGRGAATGGAIGAGTGLFLGTLTCVATGPFLFAPCMGIVVPSTTAAGAVGGAAGGALISESADDMAAKRGMLTEALNAPGANQRLVSLVEQKRLGAEAAASPAMEQVQTTAEPEWTLRIAMTELATVGSGSNAPYSLQATANLEMVRAGDAQPTFVKDFQAVSPMKMSTAEWRANNDEPVRTALDGLLAELATDMLNNLLPVERRVPAGDASKGLKAPEASDAKGNKYSSNPPNLFDAKTGINWLVVPTSPVNFGTAKKMCGALDTGDAPKYRLPTLQEFEQLWKRYKGDGQITIFNKKEYNTGDEGSFNRAGYTKTFSFDSGSSGILYAAYLACVSKE